jgi:hypothetical protein
MTSLNKTASWVIVDKLTNKAIVEIYSEQTANIIQRNHSSAYKAVPILQYLQEFNRGLHDL